MKHNIIQSIRGMRDILADETWLWSHFEDVVKQVMCSYGYSNVRFPILEKTELFNRSIGEATDIVEKEMYTFLDRNEESLTLRPEGTAGCVRLAIQNNLCRSKQKLWYMGPMFRYERPQKGRYRQFDQFGVEVFGISTVDIEVELMILVARIWKLLELSDVVLQLNSIGNIDDRDKFKKDLVSYFQKNKSLLDDDSIRRLDTNPLRILDSKNQDMQEVINQAPSIFDYLNKESLERFENICSNLKNLNISYQVNDKLVRGLDYYNDTVFEWVTSKLGSQSAICAGGRYDNLVHLLGGPQSCAVGFGMGIDRIIELMKIEQNIQNKQFANIYVISTHAEARLRSFAIAEEIREKYNLNVIVYCGSGNMAKQFQEADKNQADLALIIGEEEYKKELISIKFLRKQLSQLTHNMSDFRIFMDNYYKDLKGDINYGISNRT